MPGSAAICRPGDMCMSGPTACICRPGWNPRPNASWSSSARHRRERKELVGFQVGIRESAQSWRELLVDIKKRVGSPWRPRSRSATAPWGSGRRWTRSFPAPAISVAGFIRSPTCSTNSRSRWRLRSSRISRTSITPRPAPTPWPRSGRSRRSTGSSTPRAVACLTKDVDALLAFYDFPAEHWDHLRTANPIESVFATVRHRTVRTKGSLSQTTVKLMVFKLVQAAAKTWRRLNGRNQLPKVIEGIKFTDGIAVNDVAETSAA